MMAMTDAAAAKLTLTKTADGFVLRVDGRGTIRESPALREVGMSCLNQESSDKLTVDLSCCDFMDSTFLGCLVALHKRGSRVGPGRFWIAAPPEHRHALLSATSLDRYFTQIDDTPPPVGPPQSIDVHRLDAQSLGRHVLECHRQLAQLDGPNQQAFTRVSQRLAQELGEER
jgi:anti-anti-sigma factor